MNIVDPYAIRERTPHERIIFGMSQRQGSEETQEDAVSNFSDECFALSNGVRTLPNGEVAARFACDTAIWGYKHIRQHKYYRLDRKLFMKRIFRTTNMSIWQKRREPGFEEGLATALLIAMIGGKNFWIGRSGGSSAWHVHDGDIKSLYGEKPPFERAKGLLGMKRLGLIPEYRVGVLKRGDMLILASDGVAGYVTPSDLETAAMLSGDTEASVRAAADSLVAAAETNGSVDNMTVAVIKRIAIA